MDLNNLKLNNHTICTIDANIIPPAISKTAGKFKIPAPSAAFIITNDEKNQDDSTILLDLKIHMKNHFFQIYFDNQFNLIQLNYRTKDVG